MASSPSPPTIPNTAAAVPSSSSAAFPAIRVLLSRLSDSLRRGLAHLRPWSEALDRSAISRPDSLSDATSRLRKNIPYFRTNYAALLAAALALSLLSHPAALLLLLALLAAWCFLYLLRPPDQPLVLLDRAFSDRETLAVLVLLSVVVVFLTSVGSILVSALMIGGAIICIHGAFRVPEDMFLDDQDAGGAATGFLSFLSGAAPAAGGPAVGVRV